jgi:hypothetical protein
MLQKNVYLLYPAGYGGNYVNWAINISDVDLQETTVKDPINRFSSNNYGGPGTSHFHERIPTHQGYDHHVAWCLLNKPAEPKVYLISCNGRTLDVIGDIIRHDPDGVMIVIHDENNADVRSYANINVLTKWPTFLAARFASLATQPNFDPYNVKDDMTFRNWAVSNDSFFWQSNPIDYKRLAAIISALRGWYQVRNANQPHEVNEETYIVPDFDLLKNRLFEFSTRDLVTENFPNILDNILAASGISSGYDTSYFHQFHQNYIDAQLNLQWFESVANWERTGQLDDYLSSHSMIQAQIIQRILARSHCVELNNLDRDQWISFYTRVRGTEWPDMPDNEHGYYDLPDWVQKEIQEFGYEFKVPAQPIKAMLTLDWRNATIEEINQVYQDNRLDK